MAKENSKGIIALLTIKGGAGKTTLAACLGAEFHHRGETVTLIDADPQESLTAWHSNGGKLSEIPLIRDAEETVSDTAIEQSKSSLVIVDTAGFANSTTIGVAAVADTLLIPCRASGIDARQALQTINLCQAINQQRPKPARIKVVMTAINRAAIVSHIRNEMTAAGAEVLGCEIGQRTSYPEAELSGSAPCWMGKSAQKAAEEIHALAEELSAKKKPKGNLTWNGWQTSAENAPQPTAILYGANLRKKGNK
jgi:chromosome partitioning protein